MQNESPQLNPRLQELLLPAYRPCPAFTGVCFEMRWDPPGGHVPRGACGATGELTEVKLVLVCAEPGDPYADENYGVGLSAEAYLRSAYFYTYKCYKEGTDLFQRNMRLILDLCWPEENFDQQLRKTLIVDSVLCSAKVESGKVSGDTECGCRCRYFEKLLAEMPRAVVVALGGKAYKRLAQYCHCSDRYKISGVLKAFSAAPPGCNYHGALPSWQEVARRVRSRADGGV